MSSGLALPAQAQMDSIYRYQRHIYDATRAYYLLGRDRLISELKVKGPGATVLEIGCGTGRNLIKIATAYPDAKLYGLDVSTQMLATAEAAIGRRGFSGRIKLSKADATSFEAATIFPCEAFDSIVMSYALSMIPDWRGAVRQAVRSLACGGSVHIVDFGGFSRFPGPLQRLQLSWLKLFHVRPIEGLREQLEAFSQEAGLAFSCQVLHGDYAVLARLSKV